MGTAYEFATGQRLASADFEGGKQKLAYIAMARVCAALLRYSPKTPRPVWALGSGSWHGNDTLWLPVRQWREQDLLHDAEHRGGGADAEGECDRCGSGEPRTLA